MSATIGMIYNVFMITAPKITTAEQLLQAGDIGRCELVRGKLNMMSPAGASHGDIANTVAFLLTEHVRKHRLGKVFAAETGFMISQNPDTVRAPDAAFVKETRIAKIGPGFFPGAPDLAVEVLSPSDTAGETFAKVNDWLRAGSTEVWVVDPKRKTLAIYSILHPVRTLNESDALACEPMLPGFQVAVADIFR